MKSTISRFLLLILLSFFLSACMLTDRRDPITVWDDRKTENQIKHDIAQTFSTQSGFHVNVTTYNQDVLLTGQVPTQADKERLTTIAESVETIDVETVYNEVTVGPVTGLVQRTTDTWVTSKIKSYFTASNKIGLMRMQVITENGTVYLMGLVTQQEAELATEKAREVKGVEQVVRLFEYVN